MILGVERIGVKAIARLGFANTKANISNNEARKVDMVLMVWIKIFAVIVVRSGIVLFWFGFHRNIATIYYSLTC